jgi:DNA-binding LacI/PurR family transcriptional regulator
MVTSEQVARLAGVSRATVSRVLNGSSSVREETKKRIFAAMTALGYQPGSIAIDASNQRSRTIALMLFQHEHGLNFSHITQTHNYFFLDILKEIEAALSEAHYDLLIPSRPYHTFDTVDDNQPGTYIQALQARHIEGVLAVAINLTDPRIQALAHSEIPTVFLDNIFKGEHATSIKSDFVGGAKQAIKYLLQLGHRRIACFPGDPITPTGTERLLGYQQALAQAGYTLDPVLVRPSGWDFEDAYEAAMTLLRERRDFTAIFAASDMMAIGILQALHEYHIRVPEEISIIGFDDIDLSKHSAPPLTTMRQDTQVISQGAVSTLVQMIEGEKVVPAPMIVSTRLIVRSSTASVSTIVE